MTWSTITWDVARAGGFVAYGLVTLSIALGLVLSQRWRSSSWPRWATTDLHRYVTLLALVFTGLHTLAVWLDPFMRFTPGEVFVPLLSHYRPFWTALGIVAAYLLFAIWLSERAQRRIGYAWWRRLHYLTFGIYGLVTVHGIGTGSDTRTGWALLIYAGSFLVIGSLLAIRLLTPGPHMKPRPRVAGAVALVALVVVVWMASGPLRPGWNALANGGRGSGARISTSGTGNSAVATSTGISLPFTSDVQGTLQESGGNGGFGLATAQIDATLSDGPGGSLQIVMRGQPDGNGGLTLVESSVVLTPASSAPTYQGQIASTQNGTITADCTDVQGDTIHLNIQLSADNFGNVTGTVHGASA